MTEPTDNEPGYVTVVNVEEQYSIWPSTKPVPLGWTVVGKPASKQSCLDFIEREWTDMRPLSLRQRMDG